MRQTRNAHNNLSPCTRSPSTFIINTFSLNIFS